MNFILEAVVIQIRLISKYMAPLDESSRGFILMISEQSSPGSSPR